MRTFIRTVSVALLGAAAALLVSCGSSGKGLIPSANAGPLQSDFEAVAQAAAVGNGDCAATESALGKTEQDFLALPASVDGALHSRLELGISNLGKRALAMCIQPTATATSTTSTETTPTTTSTSTETTPTTTPSTTTTTTTTETTPTTTTSPSQSGGTEASGEGSSPGAGVNQEGTGNGGANAGGASPGAGQ
jgi:hypothetical protein